MGKSKKKHKDSSSSEEESDRAKKKKKKHKKSSSDSSSSSESSNEKDLSNLHPDESIIKMVTEMQRGASKSGKKPDNMLMELLSKMSEAYMSAKTENGEYQQKIDNMAI